MGKQDVDGKSLAWKEGDAMIESKCRVWNVMAKKERGRMRCHDAVSMNDVGKTRCVAFRQVRTF